MEKPIAYISCPHTNKDAVVLTNINGVLIPDSNPDEYLVIGYYHPDGPEASSEWMNCNQDLCAELNENVVQAFSPAAEEPVANACPTTTTPEPVGGWEEDPDGEVTLDDDSPTVDWKTDTHISVDGTVTPRTTVAPDDPNDWEDDPEQYD